MIVLWEGPSSVLNERALVLGCWSNISSKASLSITEGLLDRGLFSKLISSSLKPLNHVYDDSSRDIHTISFAAAPTLSRFLSEVA